MYTIIDPKLTAFVERATKCLAMALFWKRKKNVPLFEDNIIHCHVVK